MSARMDENEKLSVETVVQEEVTATNTDRPCVYVVETVLSYCAHSIHKCEKTEFRELLQMTSGKRGECLLSSSVARSLTRLQLKTDI